ncbi:MAG: pyridoxal-5'-phosphate-dependent protein [Solibacterales bacterium]|nr:pyridoxal-5'-phosphate-dependent protein [Bryobacterales bacterium]
MSKLGVNPITSKDIEVARDRLSKYLRPTPLILSESLSHDLGCRVWLKLESQQPTGSFKVRPAFNSILSRLDQARQVGIVTSSSGNFAQAIAYAARTLGVSAQIVMMKNTSPLKRAMTEHFGGEVVSCENTFKDRWDTTFRIQKETGRLLLHPYDSDETIAGNGTIGLELLDELGGNFSVVAPISGGGLISGIATVIKRERPGCRVFGVQPAANQSMQQSLAAGQPVTVAVGTTIADALVVACPGERGLRIVEQLVDDVFAVNEEDLRTTVRYLATKQKVVSEPGGAAAVAALRVSEIADLSKDVVCILSGANVSSEMFCELLISHDV